MRHHLRSALPIVAVAFVCLLSGWADGQEPATRPAKVYVPYEQLKGVFESEKQGVFLPYDQFRRLWSAARGSPAGVEGAPMPYLISTARFTGKVDRELASMKMELTVDVLASGWVEVPIGLGEVGVAKVSLAGPGGADKAVRPLLRVEAGQYRLLTRGKGRYVLTVEFVRQLITRPGLNILRFRVPSAAINTLELLIPEENMKVDVKPMLAATTSQVQDQAVKSTKLQAFLGATESVELRWQPKTQAAAELAAVVIADQLQHIDVGEALVGYQVTFHYDIRRRGVNAFTIQLPADFRVTAVEGANISKWDIPGAGRPGPGPKNLQVNLFSAAKGAYTLTVKMERFLTEDTIDIPLTPVVTQQVLRRTGLVAITHSPRRSVELRALKELGRVDTDRLPQALRTRAGVTAWRFITSDYAGTLAVGSVLPRIAASHDWGLDVDDDTLTLQGRLTYRIERSGVFELAIHLPELWEVLSLGPDNLVDDYRLTGQGAARMLNVLLKKERTGSICLQLRARAPRDAPDAPVDFVLPAADAKNLKLYSGRLLLHLAERLRAEVAGLDQFQALPLGPATGWQSLFGFTPSMAFQFQAIDRTKPVGARFRIAVKPTQISAVVHQLVHIKPGSVDQEAIVQYLVRYAPVDTFYLKMPAELADADVQITGDADLSKPRIKEKPRLAALPTDQRPAGGATRPAEAQPKWAWFKIVLQSPVMGSYSVKVASRSPLGPAESGRPAIVVVQPVLAAGRLSDQSGHVAVAKADTLAVLTPASTGLIPADPSSSEDLPYGPHRQAASLAFKYNAPPFTLSLPVIVQKEAAVFTTMVTGAIIDQKLGQGGVSRTRVIYLVATSRGDRFPINLPPDATPYQFLVNGSEAAVIPGATADERIVRLPPSAGQVTRAVVEVVYGTEKGSAALAVPTLPKGIPFQQTLWRVWAPADDVILHYDRSFSPVASHQADSALTQLAQGWPVPVAFDRQRQGEVWNFVRPGAPGELSLVRMPRRWFYIPVWIAVVAVGVGLLKLSWFRRAVVVLAAVLAALVAQLFLPLLVTRLALAAAPAAGLVALLWGAHWLFVQVPRAVRGGKMPPPAKPPKPSKPPRPESPLPLAPAGPAEAPPQPESPPDAPPEPADDSPAEDDAGQTDAGKGQ